MDEFIECFKRWLEREKEEGHIADWGLIEAARGWSVEVEVDGDEDVFFVTIEPA